jgi:hypothetical protein
MARAGNGHVLVAYGQVDGDHANDYLVEFDGTSWGAPVVVDYGGYPNGLTIVATATTFVLAWSTGTNPPVSAAAFTGSGLSTITSLGNAITQPGSFQLATDGNKFMVVWNDIVSASTEYSQWSASDDGLTWSTPQNLESVPTGREGLRGGPFGFLEWSIDYKNTHMNLARVFRNGSWSASTALGDYNSGCDGAVGANDALLVCPTSFLGAAQFTNGTWSNVGNIDATFANPTRFMTATDGSSYRFDWVNASDMSSLVFSAGAWSSVIDDSSLTGVVPYWMTNVCGGWSMATEASSYAMTAQGTPDWSLSTANGSAAYSARRPLPAGALQIPSPNGIDAAWGASSPSSRRVPVAYVDLGL